MLPEKQNTDIDADLVISDFGQTIAKIEKKIANFPKVCDAENLERHKKAVAFLKSEYKRLSESRKPITQYFDLIKKQFTESESKIKSFSEILQKQMDVYAAEIVKKKREQAAVIAKEAESKRIQSEFDTQYNSTVADGISEFKRQVNVWFEYLTCEQIEKFTDLDNFSNSFTAKIEKFNFKSGIYQYHSASDLAQFKPSTSVKAEADVRYLESRDSVMNDLYLCLPDKYEQLKTLTQAEAEAEAAERLAELESAAQIEKELEAAALEAAAATAKLDAELKSIQVESAVVATELPKIKTTQTLVVLDMSGFDEVYKFWRTRADVSKESIETIGKVSFERMRLFTEKECNKNESYIKHNSLRWEESVKMK